MCAKYCIIFKPYQLEVKVCAAGVIIDIIYYVFRSNWDRVFVIV